MYNNYKKVGRDCLNRNPQPVCQIKESLLSNEDRTCLARLDRISLTYLWQSEETLMINSLDHKSFPSMTN